MLQWIPGPSSEIIWNDRQDGRFVSHILDVKTSKKRTLPAPIYALSPDGRWAVTTDFRRLNDCRPGYGYTGIPDPNKDVLAPKDVGIWRMDLASGKRDLIVPVAEAASIPGKRSGPASATRIVVPRPYVSIFSVSGSSPGFPLNAATCSGDP